MDTLHLVGGLAFLAAIAWIVYVHIQLRKDVAAITDSDKKAQAHIEVYKTTSTLAGGAAVVAGLFVTVLQLAETREQFNHQASVQAKEIRQKEEALRFQRFEKGIESLESKDASKRTSGVLTISMVANEDPDQFSSIVNDVLVAFIREGLSTTRREEARNKGLPWPSRDKPKAISILASKISNDEADHFRLNKLDLSDGEMISLNANNVNFSDSDFSRANLSKSKLKGCKFNGSMLNEVNLSNSELHNADLTSAQATGAQLKNAILEGALMDGANLAGSSFIGTSLVGVSLKNANLKNANFLATRLINADLRGADLSGAIFLTTPQLTAAIGDSLTILPDTVAPPPHWK